MTAAVWSFLDGVLLDEAGVPTAWPELLLFGDPVAHSVSPSLQQDALDRRSIKGRYRAVRIPPTQLAQGLQQAWSGGVRGINLTLPHKTSVLQHVGGHSEECREIGAANTLTRRGDHWRAHNTDARGFALALERSLGNELSAKLTRCMVLGAGGAARAVTASLQALGAQQITVVARDFARASWAVERALTLTSFEAVIPDDITMLVQCTPLGLDLNDPSPLSFDRVSPDCFVADLTYASAPSRFLIEAEARGCAHMDGRPMLVAQAALAFSMWYGSDPPLESMASAAGFTW